MSQNRQCNCGSTRIMSVFAKCKDLCYVSLDGEEKDGYVPDRVNIGGGDYVNFDVCVQCGHMFGTWPLSDRAHMIDDEDEDEDECIIDNRARDYNFELPGTIGNLNTPGYHVQTYNFQPPINNLGVSSVLIATTPPIPKVEITTAIVAPQVKLPTLVQFQVPNITSLPGLDIHPAVTNTPQIPQMRMQVAPVSPIVPPIPLPQIKKS
jgi:hypothetical protein